MDERPNIVMIITDQQRYDTIKSLGASYMITPNLDQLVADGVSFCNHFVTAASCAPSRASLFTGCYPHTTGVFKNGDIWRHSWVEDLSAGGYHCTNIGKMHTSPFDTPMGFHERFVVENKDRYHKSRYFFDCWDMAFRSRGLVKQQRELYRKLPDYNERLGAFEWNLPEEMHSDIFVGELAAWWIQTKPVSQPFFLQIGFPGPHPPFDPSPRAIELYRDVEVPIPETTPEEIAHMPPALREFIGHNTRVDHDSVVWSPNPSREQLRRLRQYYAANVTMIDEQVGGIVSALKEREYLENTIVVFTSDHGECLGDHALIHKWCMYDVVTRTPLIVRYPRRFLGGRSVDSLCQQIDIVPALLELAGVSSSLPMEGLSLMPHLDGHTTDDLRQYVFAEQARHGPLTDADFITMVRDKRWKLVHYEGTASPQGELYDLESDPEERKNLWTMHGRVHEQRRLEDAILQWRIRSSLISADRNLEFR